MLRSLFTLATAAVAAVAACNGYSSRTSTCVVESQHIGGTSYKVQWYLPSDTPTALMLVQHGFSRNCGTLLNTSKAIAEKGIMVLCVEADMTAGNPGLGDHLGDELSARTLKPPGGRALPFNYIVGGHSAGGHFASVVGARLVTKGYAGLKGAILFDGVASDGFTANLQAISASGSRPVLQMAARPSLANLFNNAFEAFASLGADFVGIQLVWTSYTSGVAPTGGSCHIDAEGENTDIIGIIGAGCTPDKTQVDRLREFGATWASDLATGIHTATHWCANSRNLDTCGREIKRLVDRTFPLAALVRNS
ncbi:hypothetical protein B0H66DRAFT_592161 [Apodospora peruviana]|uniref:Uncharacterized protein n=1 Tax=Apodospora peruviana TaxID=516989 RepID=A0AAE0HZV7_9PEZI|nr:hypothetical protein B0H66DRAFT_592161 [Apodospora peruviana]